MPFEILRKDITKMEVDAIVNSTSPSLVWVVGLILQSIKKQVKELLKERASFGMLETTSCHH